MENSFFEKLTVEVDAINKVGRELLDKGDRERATTLFRAVDFLRLKLTPAKEMQIAALRHELHKMNKAMNKKNRKIAAMRRQSQDQMRTFKRVLQLDNAYREEVAAGGER